MINGALHIGHVMAATDESDAGRQAVGLALDVALRAHARATVMRVLPFDGTVCRGAIEQLQRWVESDRPSLGPSLPIEYAVAYGVPGVEISRTGERIRADMLVLGRQERTQAMRLLLGDTADAVARRSGIPCLFVPTSGTRLRSVLVTIDGTKRGRTVLRTASAFARQVGTELRVLTVEPVHAGEPADLAVATPVASTAHLLADLDDSLALDLEVRRGHPAEQILEAVEASTPDLVVIGCHRGGPAGVIEAGSTARQVIHHAPCAVLTVPL
jgi:nucleotide-binding universal stress UspA family protein